MTKRPFAKPATTFTQQVAILKSRGMSIPDPAKAEFYLQHLNYYRLVAYWLPFEADHGSHAFLPGTSFDAVLNLYVFDRELRLLVLDAIERVEVSVRCQWAYQLAHKHGPHAHLDQSIARRADYWQHNCDSLSQEVSRSDETFIKHLCSKYLEDLPPVWAACEVMSLGLLSRWYTNLKPMPTRRAISNMYKLDEGVLASWLHHLTYIRNVCAHHSRLWNREFTVTAVNPKSKPAGLHTEFRHGSRKIYNTFIILLHFMDIIAPNHSWRSRVKELLRNHAIPVAQMDFPSGWERRTPWQDR